MNHTKQITLTVSAKLLPKFFQLLEQGFLVESAVGCSLRNFISKRLGLDGEYLASSVQTIFLDHNPVDDLDKALIRENSTVALSAAMPGLAGATLRKGGRFAVMRKQISCGGAADSPSGEKTAVTVKLFNAVAKDLGQKFLKDGIRIQGSTVNRFADQLIEAMQAHIRSAQVDGEPVDPHQLVSITWKREFILQVSAF